MPSVLDKDISLDFLNMVDFSNLVKVTRYSLLLKNRFYKYFFPSFFFRRKEKKGNNNCSPKKIIQKIFIETIHRIEFILS